MGKNRKRWLLLSTCIICLLGLESCGPKPKVDPNQDNKESKDYPFPDESEPSQ